MNLTKAKVVKAMKLWSAGKTLGQIAKILKCSVYDLSPWIYSQEIKLAIKKAEERK